VSHVLEAKYDMLTELQEIFSLTEKINIAQAENARLKTIENVCIH